MMLAKPSREKSTEAAPQSSLTRWLPLLITLLAGALGYGLFYNRSAWLSVIGYSVSPAERVLQGEVPYRDFLYNYTPGILWLNAFFMRIFGTTLLTINLGLLVFKLATLVVLYQAAKRLIGAWAALVPVALSLSWIGYKYIFGIFPTQYAMLFVLLGLIFMLRFNEDEGLRFLLLSGLCIGIVFLFKYNVGILLGGCGTLALVTRELTLNEKKILQSALAALKKACIYWLGFALALLPLVIYLTRHQALRAMLDHFLHHASAYGHERAVPLPSLKLLAPTVAGLVVVVTGAWLLLRRAPKFFSTYLVIIFLLAAIALVIPQRAFIIKNSAMAFMAYLPIFLFIGITLAWFWQWKKTLRGEPPNDESASQNSVADDRTSEPESEIKAPSARLSVCPSPGLPVSRSPGLPHSLTPLRLHWWQQHGALIIVAWFALGAYMELYPRADYYHLVRALPPTFLLIAVLGAQLLSWLRERLAKYVAAPHSAVKWSGGVALALLMLVGLVNTWQPNFDSHFRLLDRTPLAIERGQGILVPPKQAEFIKELTALIIANSAPDETVFSFGQRGTGFYFLAGRRNPTKFVWWRNVGIGREDREAVMQMINQQGAKLILLQDSLKDARVREAVNANYTRVGAASGLGVYARNP